MGIIFQDFQLLEDRNVFQNLKFVLEATDWKKSKSITKRIDEVLDLVNMSTKKHKATKSIAKAIKKQQKCQPKQMKSNQKQTKNN